eukprot:792824_1
MTQALIRKLGNFTSGSHTLENHSNEDDLIKIDKKSMDFSHKHKSSTIYQADTPKRVDNEDANSRHDDSKGDEKSNGDDNEYEIIQPENTNNKPTSLYFEKQEWEMCLLHSLNALFQEKKFTETDMDDICKLLAPNKLINPHKSIFQTGNYDANVLMMALDKQGVDVQWFDSRKAEGLRLEDTFLCPKDKYKEFKGFILNNPHKRMIVFNRRHWLTIKRIGNIWYNLDSRNNKPVKYQGKKQIKKLDTIMKTIKMRYHNTPTHKKICW